MAHWQPGGGDHFPVAAGVFDLPKGLWAAKPVFVSAGGFTPVPDRQGIIMNDKPPMSNARISGIVATVVLVAMFVFVGVFVWMGS